MLCRPEPTKEKVVRTILSIIAVDIINWTRFTFLLLIQILRYMWCNHVATWACANNSDRILNLNKIWVSCLHYILGEIAAVMHLTTECHSGVLPFLALGLPWPFRGFLCVLREHAALCAFTEKDNIIQDKIAFAVPRSLCETLLREPNRGERQCWIWSGFRNTIQPDSAIQNRTRTGLDLKKNWTGSDMDLQTALITAV